MTRSSLEELLPWRAVESHEGSLVVFGGAVTIEPDSTVNGDVVLMGGTVEIGGHVNGNVVGIGGAVRLNEAAIVNGDVFTLGAALRREEGAVVNGQVVNGFDLPYSVTIPDDESVRMELLPPTPPTVNCKPKPYPEYHLVLFPDLYVCSPGRIIGDVLCRTCGHGSPRLPSLNL